MRKRNSYVRLVLFIGLVILFVIRNKGLENYYGINYNEKRKNLGLIEIDEEWNRAPHWGAKTTYWKTPNPDVGHFKKVLEFNLLNAKAELDYYKQKDSGGNHAFSKYRFEDNSMTYFLITYNSFEDGVWESEHIKQIEKTDFVDFINESKTTANKK